MMGQAQVADAILGQEIFQHYDKPRVAQMCEQQGLVERASRTTATQPTSSVRSSTPTGSATRTSPSTGSAP